jgi:hypothetical protein
MKRLRMLSLVVFVALAGCGSTFENYESTQAVDTMHMDGGIGRVELLSVESHDWLGDTQWYGYRFVAWNYGDLPLCVKITLQQVVSSGSQWGDAVLVPVGESKTVAEVWSYPGARAKFGSSRMDYKQIAHGKQCYI